MVCHLLKREGAAPRRNIYGHALSPLCLDGRGPGNEDASYKWCALQGQGKSANKSSQASSRTKRPKKEPTCLPYTMPEYHSVLNLPFQKSHVNYFLTLCATACRQATSANPRAANRVRAAAKSDEP